VIWCGAGILILLAISGFMVVRTQNVIEQVIALSAVALPLMIMLALSRMKFRKFTRQKEGEHD
jgi:flagellar biosynthesis/type III secretory pathway M-ring protein FliF/YscJ